MSSADNSYTEFLDDYFAESQEHLDSIHRNLLLMEQVGPGNRIDSGLVEELLRAFHSIKGLSGMVGIHGAEQVAHAMEGALRNLKQAGTRPSGEAMDALAAGTSVIEKIITARRALGTVPDISGSTAVETAEVAEQPWGMALSAQPPNIVRVDMKRLDHLMTLVADLAISRGHVEESLRRLEAILPASAWRELQDANLLLQRRFHDLREGVMHVRMVPIGQIFDRMPYVIRGLERESHKEIRLASTGHAVEIDKLLVERMLDPLLHMVRNAVSHGLEPTEERIASGKVREGQLRLRASTEAETVIIELEDDGRGVDIERVANRARSLGLIEPGEAPDKRMESARVLQLMCTPGFSTRKEADLASGRGVGMAIVKAAISGLGGTLAMDTRPGKGTRFTIRLPLTLAIMQALIVYIGDQPFAVPRSAIHEVLRVETHALTVFENNEAIPYRGGFLPVLFLHRLFRMKAKSATSFHVFVAGSGASAVGIAVDRIAGQREIVVRPIEDSLVRVPGIAGATELGDGRPVLILDVAAIVDGMRL